jgi:hypothetical protein
MEIFLRAVAEAVLQLLMETDVEGLDEYKRAYNEAVQYGVPFLWMDDPKGLFPPVNRPTPP